jgi:hypothetical protein
MHAEMPAELRQGIAIAPFGGNRDGVDDGLSSQWLSKERNHSEIERTTDVIGIGQPGHQDHLRRERTAESCAHGKAVRRRHDQVEQNNIRVVNGRGIERLSTRRCGDDRVPFFLEPHGDQAGQFI